ncbi:MAG TPA: hypothetical protein VD861_10520, partial [Pyrinomonadaceae bacterium]|nr:hypothetical protein [Pyrinomonadaceae bacterium]
MMKRITTAAIAALVLCAALTARAATLSPTLQEQVASQADSFNLGLVIISFKTSDGLKDAHLDLLRGLGVTGGYTFKNLGMVAAPATVAQVKALAANDAVRSVWSNDPLYYFIDQARVLTGVDRIRRDAAMTNANGGIPVSGRGDFSVMV